MNLKYKILATDLLIMYTNFVEKVGEVEINNLEHAGGFSMVFMRFLGWVRIQLTTTSPDEKTKLENDYLRGDHLHKRKLNG